MVKTVYIWGAGVSAGTVPMVSQTHEALGRIIDEMESVIGLLWGDEENKPENARRAVFDRWLDIAKELQEVIGNQENRVTQDEWAKQLLNFNERRFLLLREFLSIFYPWVQRREPQNERIKSWVHSMFEPEAMKLPAHSTLLSWNYDWQIELALSRLRDPRARLQANPGHARIMRKFDSEVSRKIESDNQWMDIYKLNGDAFWVHPKLAGFSETIIGSDSDGHSAVDYWNLVIDGFVSDERRSEAPVCGLSFAFHQKEETNRFFKVLEKQIESATNLVVAGYSFPHYNTPWDVRIVRAMVNLEVVVIYDLASNQDSLTNTFNILLKNSGNSRSPLIDFRPVGEKPYNSIPILPFT